jgi:glycosyltransferase involved in cell wall biosynthesis
MKILLINNRHYRHGGAETVYFNTGNLLKQYGHEVYFFSLHSEKTEIYEFSEYFPVENNYRKLSALKKISSLPSFFNYKNAYEKLIEYIELVKPDLAHVHLFFGGLTSSIIKALTEKNIPSVHSVHDYRLVCPAYTFLDKKGNICELCKDGFYLRCAYKQCSLENNFFHSCILALDAYYRKLVFDPTKYITKFIFVSNFSKNKHIEFNKRFVNKSEVLYNSFGGEIKKTFPKRGDYFLFFGRLSREKGIDNLVKAAQRLNIKLKIVGTGTLESKYLEINSPNIELLGYKNGKELYDLISNSFFVVLPSEWYENNPLTIIESFALGKPVIGARIGGITELINEKNGYLFESHNVSSLIDKISQATTISDEEYNLICNGAYNFAIENFSSEVHYKKLIKIYKLVLDAKTNYQ